MVTTHQQATENSVTAVRQTQSWMKTVKASTRGNQAQGQSLGSFPSA